MKLKLILVFAFTTLTAFSQKVEEAIDSKN